MKAKKIHNKLERLIDSLTITENQKNFLQKKANNLFNELKNISQNQIPYWSSLYLSKNTYKHILKQFWWGGSLDKGLFIKNRFDVNIYLVYKQNDSQPYEQGALIEYQLFELLYSHLKVYHCNHRDHIKLLAEPPYTYSIPIRMDYHGISILFDCIPAIELPDGDHLIPIGIGGLKSVNPILIEQAHSKLNKKQGGKITKLNILMKYWNFNWGKPVKNYLIEKLVELIFDKIKVQSWDQTVKTYFNQAIYILDKEKALPDRKDNQYSLLDDFSSNDLKNFLDLLKEAEVYARNSKWNKIFSDL